VAAGMVLLQLLVAGQAAGLLLLRVVRRWLQRSWRVLRR
jgi:hypothetical protein